MSTVFDCDWEDGSGWENTGGSYVWVDRWGGSLIDEDTGSRVFDTDSIRVNGYIPGGYGATIGAEPSVRNNSGCRFVFRWDTCPLTSGQQKPIFRVHNGGTDLLKVYIVNDSGTIKLKYGVWDSGGTERTVGTSNAVTQSEIVQVRCRLARDTSNGASWDIYEEDGTTVHTSEQTLSGYTTRDSQHYQIWMGEMEWSYATWDMGFDSVFVDNAYILPDTIQQAGGLSIPVAMRTYRNMRN